MGKNNEGGIVDKNQGVYLEMLTTEELVNYASVHATTELEKMMAHHLSVCILDMEVLDAELQEL